MATIVAIPWSCASRGGHLGRRVFPGRGVQPARDVADVVLEDRQPVRVCLDLRARRLADERWSASSRYPSCSRRSDGRSIRRPPGPSACRPARDFPVNTTASSKRRPVAVLRPCASTVAIGHAADTPPSWGWAGNHSTRPLRSGRVQQFVHRPVGEHRLIVAVGAGVVVGPGDGRGVLVVATACRVDRSCRGTG